MPTGTTVILPDPLEVVVFANGLLLDETSFIVAVVGFAEAGGENEARKWLRLGEADTDVFELDGVVVVRGTVVKLAVFLPNGGTMNMEFWLSFLTFVRMLSEVLVRRVEASSLPFVTTALVVTPEATGGSAVDLGESSTAAGRLTAAPHDSLMVFSNQSRLARSVHFSVL
jgi:hypothetical protein